MKKVIVLIIAVGWIGKVNGITFTRYPIDQGLNRSHGVWSGDVQGTHPPYVNDAFGTIGYDYQAVWYKNSGNGTVWGPKQVIYTSDRICFEIAAADFDNDGDVDAVSNHFSPDADSGWIAIHTNNGSGVFNTTNLPKLHARIRQIKPADVDGDNDIDFIVACNTYEPSLQTQTGVYWYKNNGGMNFTPNFLGTYNAWKLDYADFNGDNHLEFAVTEEWFGASGTSDCRLILFKNNGAEVFTPQIIDPNGDPAGSGVGGVCTADFDGDGEIDIVTGARGNQSVYLYKNNGGWPNPTFTKSLIDGSAPEYDGADKCDFDIDGDMDFVAAGRSYWFAWYENDGSGGFTKHILDTEFQLLDLPHTTYLRGDSCCDILLSVDGSNSGRFFAYLNSAEPCIAAVEEKEYAYSSNWLKVPSIIGNNVAQIEYSVADKGNIRLEVIDITGRIIQVLDEGYYSQPGVYRAAWNLSGEPNGIYIVRLVHRDNSPIIKKTIVIRGK